MTIKDSNRVYIVFLITMLVAILVKALVVIYYVDLQKDDARIINQSGKQRMLSQGIAKIILLYNKDKENFNPQSYESLLNKSQELINSHSLLIKESQRIQNTEIEKILKSNQEFAASSFTLISNMKNLDGLNAVTDFVLDNEEQYLTSMDAVTRLFQSEAERKIENSKMITYFLAFLTILIILIEYFLIVKPASSQIYNKNVKLNRANKQLSDFAQITAHNLRAPIGNLGFLVDFYKSANSENEKDELFENVEAVVGHLDETIKILVESISIKTKDNIELENLDLKHVFETTKQMLVGEIRASKAIVTCDFSNVSQLNYSKVYLDSIFLNLIGNSLKYRAESRIPEIHVSSSLNSGSVTLKFKDNGLGINLERQGSKIFKLHKTFHRHKDAKGIGLFMTRNQIQAMGGDITVTSEVDKGTEFTVVINS